MFGRKARGEETGKENEKSAGDFGVTIIFFPVTLQHYQFSSKTVLFCFHYSCLFLLEHILGCAYLEAALKGEREVQDAELVKFKNIFSEGLDYLRNFQVNNRFIFFLPILFSALCAAETEFIADF